MVVAFPLIRGRNVFIRSPSGAGGVGGAGAAAAAGL